MKAKILVITATQKELEALDLDETIISHVCGIGLCSCGVESMWAIEKYKPSMVILVGIAGRYAHSELKIGDSVLVKKEIVADCGGFYKGKFVASMSQEYECAYAKDYGFGLVDSASVNVCAAPFLDVTVDIENMEGAAFFAAAIKCGIPFLELRTVSNTVSDKRDDWDIALAFDNMRLALKKLLNEIEA